MCRAGGEDCAIPYLIDGHNLIGQMPDIALDDPNDEALLVERLQRFTARTGKRCVVVFDGGLPGGASRMSTGKVRVVFAAAHHSDADRVMIERIRKTRDPSGWTVVSSDEAVLTAARRRRMKTLRAREFAGRLRGSLTSPADSDGEVYLSPEEVEEWLNLFGGD